MHDASRQSSLGKVFTKGFPMRTISLSDQECGMIEVMCRTNLKKCSQYIKEDNELHRISGMTEVYKELYEYNKGLFQKIMGYEYKD